MITFTWTPSNGADESRKPRVLSGRFGDGYEQRVADGINNDLSAWSVAFNARSATGEIADIAAFLTARGGVESFLWTDPNGKAAAWICREWSVQRLDRNLSTMTAKFEQVPA